MNSRIILIERGFSLIELTVVLLIITLLAGVALRSTNELSFHVRYEQTQERLQRIREAILGNPRQIINGQQAVSGFVSDMGRLPNNIHELLEKDFCSDRSYPTQAICEANGQTWSALTTWHVDAASGLGVGWRGPYLIISGNALEDDAYPDGWGKIAANAADHNYGWGWMQNTGLTIFSYGKDQMPGGGCSDSDYNGDCFEQISVREYQTDISSGITMNIKGAKFSLDSHCSNAMYTSRTACEANQGAWFGGCSEGIGGTPSYANKAACEAAGKTWRSCSLTSYTTQTDCESNQGIWYGEGYGCSDPTKPDQASCGAGWHGCSDKTQTTRAACEATTPASNWFGDGTPSESRLLCLSVYYHKDGAIDVRDAIDTRLIVEDGNNHNLAFSFPANTIINNGQISIALFYQRGAGGCQKSMPYPLDGRPLPVMVYANSTLPVINWR